MYNVHSRPAKIITKARCGMNQKLDTIDSIRDLSRKSPSSSDSGSSPQEITSPKLVFRNVDGKNASNKRDGSPLSPEAGDLVKFVQDSWNKIYSDYESGPHPGRPVYYREDKRSLPQGFKPFDLESWWRNRIFNQLATESKSND